MLLQFLFWSVIVIIASLSTLVRTIMDATVTVTLQIKSKAPRMVRQRTSTNNITVTQTVTVIFSVKQWVIFTVRLIVTGILTILKNLDWNSGTGPQSSPGACPEVYGWRIGLTYHTARSQNLTRTTVARLLARTLDTCDIPKMPEIFWQKLQMCASHCASF